MEGVLGEDTVEFFAKVRRQTAQRRVGLGRSSLKSQCSVGDAIQKYTRSFESQTYFSISFAKSLSEVSLLSFQSLTWCGLN